jgi:ubiquinone/menaquinone biosynthesis C-methylase UbiE
MSRFFATDGRYLPALRFHALTRWYDRVVATTTRSEECISRLVALASPATGAHVLDIGCGTGSLLAALASSRGATLAGLDADPEALALAKRKLPPGRVALHRGLAQRLPFADAVFDLVVSSLFFHHLPTEAKRQVLGEAARVLKPSGRLLVADWGAADGPSSKARFMLVRLLDGFETTRDSVEGTLPALIAATGFEQPREHPPLAVPLGTVRFWEARRC